MVKIGNEFYCAGVEAAEVSWVGGDDASGEVAELSSGGVASELDDAWEVVSLAGAMASDDVGSSVPVAAEEDAVFVAEESSPNAAPSADDEAIIIVELSVDGDPPEEIPPD